MGFNSGFKGLSKFFSLQQVVTKPQALLAIILYLTYT